MTIVSAVAAAAMAQVRQIYEQKITSWKTLGGADTVDGGGDGDIAYHGKDASLTGVERAVTVELADLPAQIRVEGSAEFAERVRAAVKSVVAAGTTELCRTLEAALTG